MLTQTEILIKWGARTKVGMGKKANPLKKIRKLKTPLPPDQLAIHIDWLKGIIFYIVIPLILLIVGSLIVFYFTEIRGLRNSLHAKIDGVANRLDEKIDRFQTTFWEKISRYSIEMVKGEKNPGFVARIYLSPYDFSEKNDLYSITGLKEFANAANADWSPDSRKIAFISIKGSEGQGEICVYDFLENSIAHLSKAGEENSFPKFSPDGKTIIFSTRNPGDKNRWDIARISINNEQLELLTGELEENGKNEKYFGFNRNILPRWSPEGKKIIFCGDDISTKEEGFFLFLMDSDGKNRTKICELGNVCDPSFSPNGNFIVFRSAIDNPYEDIWLAPFRNGQCVSDECPTLKEIKNEIPGLIRINSYYLKKLTNIGSDSVRANGHLDPVWANNEEIIYLYTNEYVRSLNEKQKWWEVNWKVRKMNVFLGDIQEFPLAKAVYRNPQIKDQLVKSQ